MQEPTHWLLVRNIPARAVYLYRVQPESPNELSEPVGYLPDTAKGTQPYESIMQKLKNLEQVAPPKNFEPGTWLYPHSDLMSTISIEMSKAFPLKKD